MISDGKVYDAATCEIPDYKALMDGVTKGTVTETPWIDEKEWDNGRVLETFISSDAVDVQGDSILQRGLVKVMPWLNKYGYYEWHHTGFPVGHYLGWRMKDGKVQVRVGFHDTAHSNMPAHDKAWQIVREFGAKGRSSIKGAPNAIKKLMSGVRVIDDLGCFAVGWVGDNAANPFAEVTSVSFAKGAALKKTVEQQGDRWAVVSEGAADPIATFATKEEADATLNAIEDNKKEDSIGKEHRRLKYFSTESEARAFADTVSTVHSPKGEVEEDALKGQWYVVFDEKSATRAPDSLHDKIAKELFGKALQDLDDIQKAQVTRRAEELLMLQAEELFKERAAGRISLAIYGELLLFKERAIAKSQSDIEHLAKKPLSELRRMQAINQQQMSEAARQGSHDAVAEAQRREKEYIEAIMRHEWPEDFKSKEDKPMDDDKKPKEQEQKLEVEKAEVFDIICPECGSLFGRYSGKPDTDYCPSCHASIDMRENGPNIRKESARLQIKAFLAKEGVIKTPAKILIKEWLVKDSGAQLPQEHDTKEKEAQTTMKPEEVKKEAPAPPSGGAQAGNIESRVDALDKAMSEIKGMLKQLVAEEGAEEKATPPEAKPEQPRVEDMAEKAAQLQKQVDAARNETAKLQKELAVKRQGTGSAQVDNTAPDRGVVAKAFESVMDGSITGTEFRKTVEKAIQR